MYSLNMIKKVKMINIYNMILYFLLFCIQFFSNAELLSSSWNLTSVNLDDDALIWRFTIWRDRAFLAIPRRKNDIKNKRYTLVEAPWPEISEDERNFALRPFPNSNSQSNIDNCFRSLRCVVALDIDSKGRLWVLDVPTEKRCSPKIIIYHLLRNNQELKRIELSNVSTANLRSLVTYTDSYDTRAYIGDPGDESIIVYSLEHQRWWRIKLEHDSYIPKVYSSDLAICCKSSLLYFTGYPSHDLFSLNLEDLQEMEESTEKIIKSANISWHGKKLGSSSGLFCDKKQGLHYFMINDKASVRWDSNLELTAENHLVLLQTEDVPYITHYAADSQKHVWGLSNVWFPFQEESYNDFDTKLKTRTIKVFNYSQYS
ncbi:uncharacterized protein LOC127281774 [Leptopilina boulardi]|uniref:uncharacterized protein LOC127281774 n=1 Tax=Leptopilina boulardi TaxID=63433 RepID=UPI0021F5E23E|nr:uncharacterized protein LOC127281774 [Leptopilina boulardi]